MRIGSFSEQDRTSTNIFQINQTLIVYQLVIHVTATIHAIHCSCNYLYYQWWSRNLVLSHYYLTCMLHFFGSWQKSRAGAVSIAHLTTVNLEVLQISMRPTDNSSSTHSYIFRLFHRTKFLTLHIIYDAHKNDCKIQNRKLWMEIWYVLCKCLCTQQVVYTILIKIIYVQVYFKSLCDNFLKYMYS